MRFTKSPWSAKSVASLILVGAIVSWFATGCGGREEDFKQPDAMSSGGTAGGDSSTGGRPSSSGGSASTGGQSMEAPGEIIEIADGESYELRSGDVSMTVTRANGGRITSFRIGSVETLVEEGEAEQFGSVFWPSPQTWSWPPSTSISEIDPNDYAASRDTSSVTLTSEFNATVGIAVRKKFTPVEGGGIVVEYSMLNSGSETVALAPWQVNRVSEGIAFFPSGPAGSLEKSSLEVERLAGTTWYAYAAESLSGTPKLFEDGAEGWLAFALPQTLGGALVVQVFDDIAAEKFAPGESEIELYASPSGQYFEVEQQGAYGEIAPGASVVWRTTWRGILLESPPEVGDATYLARARELATLP